MPKGKKGKSKKSAKPLQLQTAPLASTGSSLPVDNKSAPVPKPAPSSAPAASTQVSNDDLFQQLVKEKKFAELNNLGCRLMESKTENVEKRRRKETLALQCFQVVAEQNNTTAQANLAQCYLSGKGVRKDLTQMAAWLERAAKNGNLNAKVRWAIYCWKKAVKPREIVPNLQAAADQKNIHGQYYLGIYHIVRGNDKKSESEYFLTTNERIEEETKALKYLTLAVEQECIGAKFLLAKLHYLQRRISIESFHELLEKIKSNSDARHQLATFYGDGIVQCKNKPNRLANKELIDEGVKAEHPPSLLKRCVEIAQSNCSLAEVYLLKAANKGYATAINWYKGSKPGYEAPQYQTDFWVDDIHGDLERILSSINSGKEFEEEIISPVLAGELKSDTKNELPAAAAVTDQASVNANLKTTEQLNVPGVGEAKAEIKSQAKAKKSKTKLATAHDTKVPAQLSVKAPVNAETEEIAEPNAKAPFVFPRINDEPISDGIFRSYAQSTVDVSCDSDDAKKWMTVIPHNRKPAKTQSSFGQVVKALAPTKTAPKSTASSAASFDDSKHSHRPEGSNSTASNSSASINNDNKELVPIKGIVKISTPIFHIKTGLKRDENSHDKKPNDEKRLILDSGNKNASGERFNELLRQQKINFSQLRSEIVNVCRDSIGFARFDILFVLNWLIKLENNGKQADDHYDFLHEELTFLLEELSFKSERYIVNNIVNILNLLPQLNTPLIAHRETIEKILLKINLAKLSFADLSLLISILPQLPVRYNDVICIVESLAKNLSIIIDEELNKLSKTNSSKYFAQLLGGITALYWHYYHELSKVKERDAILSCFDQLLDKLLLALIKLKPLFLSQDLPAVYQALHALNCQVVPLNTSVFGIIRSQVIELIKECEKQFSDGAFLNVNLSEAEIVARLFSEHTHLKMSSLAFGCMYIAGYNFAQRLAVCVNQLGDYTLDAEGEIKLSLFHAFRDEVLRELSDIEGHCYVKNVAHLYAGSLNSAVAFKENIAGLNEFLAQKREKFPIFYSVDPRLDALLDKMKGLIPVVEQPKQKEQKFTVLPNIRAVAPGPPISSNINFPRSAISIAAPISLPRKPIPMRAPIAAIPIPVPTLNDAKISKVVPAHRLSVNLVKQVVKHIFSTSSRVDLTLFLPPLTRDDLGLFRRLLILLQTMSTDSQRPIVQIKSSFLMQVLMLGEDFPPLQDLDLQIKIPNAFYPFRAVRILELLGFKILGDKRHLDEKQQHKPVHFVNMKYTVPGDNNHEFDITLIALHGTYIPNDNLRFTRELIDVCYDPKEDRIFLSGKISPHFWVCLQQNYYILEHEHVKTIEHRGADYAHLFKWYLKFEKLGLRGKAFLGPNLYKTLSEQSIQGVYLRELFNMPDMHCRNKAYFYKEFVELIKYKVFAANAVKCLIASFIKVLLDTLAANHIIPKDLAISGVVKDICDNLHRSYAQDIENFAIANPKNWLGKTLRGILINRLNITVEHLRCLEIEKFLLSSSDRYRPLFGMQYAAAAAAQLQPLVSAFVEPAVISRPRL